jgi:hypothetical protein
MGTKKSLPQSMEIKENPPQSMGTKKSLPQSMEIKENPPQSMGTKKTRNLVLCSGVR